MPFLPFFSSKSVLGVDIGTASIKIAELNHLRDKFELKNYGILDFLSKKETDQKLYDEYIAGGIKELISRTKPSTKNSVASIPSFSTFSTVIELPYLSEKDLAKAIPFEARKYIPIPLNELVLDWTIINIAEVNKYQTSSQQNKSYPNVEVFIAAVPKEETERYRKIFLKAGLTLKALELENIALIRSLIGEDKSPLAMVNLGGRSTSIVVINKGFERISRNYEIGGFELTKALSKALRVSFERAEEIKKVEGLKSTNPSLTESITPLIDMIIFEIKKTISNFEEDKKTKITKLILTGAQANMIGLKDYFAKKIDKEVVIGNPFSRISYNKTLKPILPSLGSSLALALGLAMRKI